MHGDRGSIVIDNDELTFIHVTPQGSEGEEKAYGSLGSSENQLADFLTETKGGAATGSDPAALSRRPSAPVRELSGRAGRRASLRVDLETNRQAIAIITGAYESAAPVAR